VHVGRILKNDEIKELTMMDAVAGIQTVGNAACGALELQKSWHQLGTECHFAVSALGMRRSPWRSLSQGLPLCGGQGRVICRRSCDWLPKTAAADDGASAARLGAPQHVDIHSLASDGVKLLEIEHKLEIHIVTCGVGG